MTIQATASVTSADVLGDKVVISFDSVAMGGDGKPTFTMVMEFPANHPAAAEMPAGSIIGLTFTPTGAVALSVTPEPPKLVIVPEMPAPTPEVVLAAPVVEQSEEWKEGAAVTSPQLLNPSVSDLKRALGVVGGVATENAPAVAEAVASIRSQYAGDH